MGLSLKGHHKRRSMSDINVTPLVDIMLVLLVIFMITAPVMKEGFLIDIPQASETQSLAIEEARLIEIAKNGEVLRPKAQSTADSYATLSLLVEDLKAWKSERESMPSPLNNAPVVVIVADKDVRYERLIQVWNAVATAGIAKLSFQLSPDSPSTSP